jgi:UPF0755 protein
MTDLFDLGLSHQARKRSIFRRLLPLPAVLVSILVLVAVVAVLVVGVGKAFKPQVADDYTGGGISPVQIEVHPGDTTSQIAQTLVNAGVVKSITAFTDAAQDDAKAGDIQPGTYQVLTQMSAASALALLVSPTSVVGDRLTIPEGTRLLHLEQIIELKTKITPTQLSAALNAPDSIGLPSYANGKAEGFLFPATYAVDNSTTATQLLSQMTAQFGQVSRDLDLDSGAATLHMTPYQIVIVASLIEAEVKRPQDYPQVARVIYNRLARGMPLELDSTVNYALGTSDPFLTQAQLNTPSPYNTYVNKGLPPTPIDSPGQLALQSALNPLPGDWIYFVTTDPTTGATTFTDSLSQFNQLRIQAQTAAAAAAKAAAASAAASKAAAKPSP